jgi:hypothetical protein
MSVTTVSVSPQRDGAHRRERYERYTADCTEYQKDDSAEVAEAESESECQLCQWPQ